VDRTATEKSAEEQIAELRLLLSIMQQRLDVQGDSLRAMANGNKLLLEVVESLLDRKPRGFLRRIFGA
jgi:hypothetical protein